MIQNDQELMDATFEASDYLAQLLARYAHYEAHYRKPQITDSNQLEGAIVEVYVAVLRYSAEVKQIVQSSTSSKPFMSEQ